MIATTIEQSKKLMELGLDINSADMYWWNCHGFRLSANPYTEEVKKGFESHQLECIPAWSLSALLDISPAIDLNKFRGKYKCDYLKDEWSNGPDYTTYSYDNPIDAVFEMVVWLLENRYIKTFKNKN